MFNTDVIGRILAVSNTARVLTSSGTLKWKRIIHLGDLRYIIKIYSKF